MTRMRRLIISVVVGGLVTLPTAGSALAGESAPVFWLDGRTLNPLQVQDAQLKVEGDQGMLVAERLPPHQEHPAG